MTDKIPADIPFVVHESAMARSERREKKMLIALIVAVVLVFLSNALWLFAWMQYDYVSDTYTATQDGSGVNIIGGGSVSYGTESNDQEALPD